MDLEVDLAHFAAAHADGAPVLDVREVEEFEQVRVPGAVLMPLGELATRHVELPRDERVYVICAHGHRSLSAAAWLRQVGVDAVSVAGGTAAWAGGGHPTEAGRPGVGS